MLKTSALCEEPEEDLSQPSPRYSSVDKGDVDALKKGMEEYEKKMQEAMSRQTRSED